VHIARAKTRLKILKALIDSYRTPSEIAKTVGVNFVKTNESLKILESRTSWPRQVWQTNPLLQVQWNA